MRENQGECEGSREGVWQVVRREYVGVWLWRVFGNVGKVIDVLLSRKKRDANSLWFAFIRFERREYAIRAIERLDGWKVWGCIIKILEVRYRRTEQKKSERVGFKDDVRENRWVEKERMTGERTYRDVVLNKNGDHGCFKIRDDNAIRTMGNSKLVLEADETKKEITSRSLVGEVTKPRKFEELRQEVMEDWQTMVDMKMMGAWKVIMRFDSVENMVEAEKAPHLLNQFLEVRRWTTGEAIGSRRFWIEINGLPANVWTTQNMEQIGNVWGTVLKIDEGKGGHFNAFRIREDYVITAKEIGVSIEDERAEAKEGWNVEGRERNEDNIEDLDSIEREVEKSINGSNHKSGTIDEEDGGGDRESPKTEEDSSRVQET
ncbi:hypothetical protein PIB30_045838 [Stylosanthes scabra]|uniref:RRM domain-containing protein n=1 Tax=Stylosanthes scabra TaxID=79078 RepID=A0ABU6VE67_9FABA|nr:hypothetical protein [Stylosanthes scabra]